MVYTPSFDGLHTDFRWFTHQPSKILRQTQSLIEHYPQRNTLFNTKYLTLSDHLWISSDLSLAGAVGHHARKTVIAAIPQACIQGVGDRRRCKIPAAFPRRPLSMQVVAGWSNGVDTVQLSREPFRQLLTGQLSAATPNSVRACVFPMDRGRGGRGQACRRSVGGTAKFVLVNMEHPCDV